MIRDRAVSHRLVLLLLALFAPIGLSRSNPTVTHPTWSGLPADLRSRVHRTVSELPPFPEDPNVLRDVRRWPKTRRFDGEPYELSLTEWDHDLGRLVKSPDEIRAGRRYEAQYMRRDPDGDRVSRGPFFVWSLEGRVVEQAYRTAEGMELRVYDPAGRVMRYSHSRPSAKRTWLSCGKSRWEGAGEWFHSSGTLVGVHADDEYYWAGVPKTYEEFHRLEREWDPWNAWRDSVRKARAGS